WERGNEKGLLHEVLDQWYKLFVPRSRQAAMLSSYLVSWEMEAEVGLTQTCFSAWQHLVQGEARRRLRERSREGVHLAVQKFLLGNQKGLLHEALSLWQHLCAKRAQRDLLLKKYLVSFEMETGVGLTQTCLASWKKLVDAQARQRSKEHGHEAVKLALQKWERGNAAGLLHEVVTQPSAQPMQERGLSRTASFFLLLPQALW
ncbi:rsc5, partial [Symbiodinium necroappetens]